MSGVAKELARWLRKAADWLDPRADMKAPPAYGIFQFPDSPPMTGAADPHEQARLAAEYMKTRYDKLAREHPSALWYGWRDEGER